MEVKVLHKTQYTPPDTVECLAVPLFDEPLNIFSSLLERADAAALERLCEKDIVSSKAQSVYLLPRPLSRCRNVLLLGLGCREKFTPETLRRAAGKAGPLLATNRIESVVFDSSLEDRLSPHAFLEGIILGQYTYDRFKNKDTAQPPKVTLKALTILCNVAADAAELQRQCDQSFAACQSANWMRDLADMPPNELTPTRLAELAKTLAKESDLAYEALDEDHIAKLGMNAILGVARGSEQRATLIVLRYRHPAAKRTLALVGKGVTFDTGGISIKPSDAMHEMKYDMCGAAAALGAVRAIAALKPAINVNVIIPAVENMPGGNAQRPGDIVKAYNGKTIEILNTDAEGRLILADALAYTVDKFKPDYVVDLATLTGACIVALGHYAAGVMATNDALYTALETAGAATGDRLWRLPLWDDYDKLIEGTHADLANIGPKGEAGAIIGGCFLKQFVGDTPWAHLDIAGVAWDAKNIPYLSEKDATGFGVRLLTQWILDEAEKPV